MKTLKEFLLSELTVVSLALSAMCVTMVWGLFDALAGNEHPTTDQTWSVYILSAFFVVLAIFMVYIAIDDFRNRVRK